MPAPKKITRREKRSHPRLSTFLKSLNLNRFRKALPRGERDPSKLYYTPESLLKATILRLMLNLTYMGLENFLRSHQRYATACGFPRGYVPDHSYYCKFFTALDDTLLEQIGGWILQPATCPLARYLL
jgi:hypothetical protein